jgi:hypothetical protein
MLEYFTLLQFVTAVCVQKWKIRAPRNPKAHGK